MKQFIIPENLLQMIDNYCRSQIPVQIVAGIQGLADYIEPEDSKDSKEETDKTKTKTEKTVEETEKEAVEPEEKEIE